MKHHLSSPNIPDVSQEGAALLTQPTAPRRTFHRLLSEPPSSLSAPHTNGTGLATEARLACRLLLEVSLEELLFDAGWCLLAAWCARRGAGETRPPAPASVAGGRPTLARRLVSLSCFL